MINIGRDEDEGALFSYASYPPTEYLLPQNSDFYTFNVYLHRQSDFESYLARLQNLAEEKPLLLGEFGMDTRQPTRRRSKPRCSAGTSKASSAAALREPFVYAWTDEWWCDGQEITDWAFGTRPTRDRTPKLSLTTVKALFNSDESMTLKVKLPRYPKVSVIVCSYNGAKTLDRCLESLKRIEYPNYEVILVDDGSHRQHARDRRETYLDQEYSAGKFRAQRGSQCRRACSDRRSARLYG